MDSFYDDSMNFLGFLSYQTFSKGTEMSQDL